MYDIRKTLQAIKTRQAKSWMSFIALPALSDLIYETTQRNMPLVGCTAISVTVCHRHQEGLCAFTTFQTNGQSESHTSLYGCSDRMPAVGGPSADSQITVTRLRVGERRTITPAASPVLLSYIACFRVGAVNTPYDTLSQHKLKDLVHGEKTTVSMTNMTL